MSDSELPRLPDDLARLFARANAATEDQALLARIHEGVTSAVALRGIPTNAPSPATAPLAKVAAMKIATLAAAGGLAVGLGAGHEWGKRESVPVAMPSAAPTVIAAPASETPSVDVHSLPSASAVAPLPTAAPAKAVESARTEGRSALRRERELVDAAAGSLRSGHPEQALAVGEQHARQFPDGQLVEDREVIVIEALLALGRKAEANARIERFRQKFPASPAGQRLRQEENRTTP